MDYIKITNEYDKSLLFWRLAQEQGKYSLYHNFLKLKYRNLNDKNIDNTGGFISRKEVKGKAIYQTILKMQKEGLIIACLTGWKLISTKKAARKLGIENLQTIKYFLHDIKEQKKLLAHKTLRRSITRQKIVTLKTNIQTALTISGQTLASQLGYKSAQTGINREKALEIDGKLLIGRDKTIEKRMLKDVNGESVVIYRRPCNNIVVIQKGTKLWFQLWCQQKSIQFWKEYDKKYLRWCRKDGKPFPYYIKLDEYKTIN